MAIKKFKNAWATKRKADWLEAQYGSTKFVEIYKLVIIYMSKRKIIRVYMSKRKFILVYFLSSYLLYI